MVFVVAGALGNSVGAIESVAWGSPVNDGRALAAGRASARAKPRKQRPSHLSLERGSKASANGLGEDAACTVTFTCRLPSGRYPALRRVV